jgi:hypothetical protein
MITTLLVTLLTTNPAYGFDTKWEEDRLAKEATITVKLTPTKGWKWNNDYTFKYKIISAGKLVISWRKFDFKRKDGAAIFAFGLKDMPEDMQGVNVYLSFSFCSKNSCRVWRSKLFYVRREIN